MGRRTGDAGAIGAAGWACTSYDVRGRMVSESWPAHGTAPARTTTYAYAVDNNPFAASVTDDTWSGATVEATVDLLGRTVSYTDIWGDTTTTVFDQAGRQTTTDGYLPTLENNYDPGNGRLDSVVFNGYTMASSTYDAVGRLSSVAYLNGSASVHAYDDYGRPDGLGIINDQGKWSGETLTRSLAGRVVDEVLFDPLAATSTDANPAGDNYLYDGAGRLTSAILPASTYAYDFATSPGCVAPEAGRNTNRTGLTVTGAGATRIASCFDHADRLVSTDTIAAGDILYDDHGNNTQLGDTELVFDAADRHVATMTPTSLTSYMRDPLDRIVERNRSMRITHVDTTSAASSSSNVSVNRPAGAQPGDLLVVAISSLGLLTPGGVGSSGWTSAGQQTGLANRTAILWRYATASDPGSWSFGSSGAIQMSASIVAYRSTVPVAPVAVKNSTSKLLQTSHPIPNVSTVTDATMLIHATGLASNAGMSIPDGTVQRAVTSSAAKLQVLDRLQVEAGVSEPVTVHTSSLANSATVTVGLQPISEVARYGHTGHSEASNYTRGPDGVTLDVSVSLPGGASYDFTPSAGWVFSHSDLHGDVIATTYLYGAYAWYGVSGPYGESAATSVPDNTAPGGTSRGWHGGDNKITDGPIVHMGVRPYSPAHGRFLAVDPVEGGCANNYTYVNGDPINTADLSGEGLFGIECGWCGNVIDGASAAIGCAGRVFTSLSPFAQPSPGSVTYQVGAKTMTIGGAVTASAAPTMIGSVFVAGSATLAAIGAGLTGVGTAVAVAGLVLLISENC